MGSPDPGHPSTHLATHTLAPWGREKQRAAQLSDPWTLSPETLGAPLPLGDPDAAASGGGPSSMREPPPGATLGQPALNSTRLCTVQADAPEGWRPGARCSKLTSLRTPCSQPQREGALPCAAHARDPPRPAGPAPPRPPTPTPPPRDPLLQRLPTSSGPWVLSEFPGRPQCPLSQLAPLLQRQGRWEREGLGLGSRLQLLRHQPSNHKRKAALTHPAPLQGLPPPQAVPPDFQLPPAQACPAVPAMLA